MKRLIGLGLFLAILLSLVACGQKAPTWQEQYDLGVRFLSEGNYKEAIVAFTAAIEIDPKRVEAYIGRGDAYIGSGEADENLAAAQSDYESALELDQTRAEVYLKLTEIYLARDDETAVIELLERGYAVTGDERLNKMKTELLQSDSIAENEIVTVIGHIIDNAEEYSDKYNVYRDLYQNNVDVFCYITGPGVRFNDPVLIKSGNGTVTIQESRVTPNEQISHDMIGSGGSLIGKTIRMEGYFFKSDLEELTGPEYDASSGYTYYKFNPNGEYIFHINNYQEIVQ